jgi:Rieske Fe-S protein
MNQTRRTVLAGAAGASAAAMLSACADGKPGPEPTAPSPSEPAKAAAVGALAATHDIPLNGGMIFADHGIVVTQPTPGDFKAFSYLCTHKGCALASVENGTINCKCHGARFALADGSVQGGPAKRPLDVKVIKVENNTISLT